MATSKAPKIVIERGFAAAIVSLSGLPKPLKATISGMQKFVVHPHISEVEPDDEALAGYLRSIYTGHTALPARYPGSSAFADLEARLERETVSDIAEELARLMSVKKANAGILFGFRGTVDGKPVHGLVKADLDDEQRFHFASDPSSGEWHLSAVKDILPSPKAEFAKYVISPQPGGRAAAGIRDVANAGSAAEYFLESVELTVPLTKGTQKMVAKAALDAGYEHAEIASKMAALDADEPIRPFVAREFPEISEEKIVRLEAAGTARPLERVLREDVYARVFRTANPRFELIVGPTVQVEFEGDRRVIVTLPPNSDPIDETVR